MAPTSCWYSVGVTMAWMRPLSMIQGRFLLTKITIVNYPRPTSGIFDAITVICNTFADNGSDAM